MISNDQPAGRKLIWAINVTIDGFADHTAVIADDELHDFHTDLLGNVDIVLFGRKTYQLMESYWPVAPEDPAATKSMIKFANTINSIPKIVFSKTLQKVAWNNTRLIKEKITEEVEYWFLVQPIILGTGKHLVEGIQDQHNLKLADTKVFNSGVVALHYKIRE